VTGPLDRLDGSQYGEPEGYRPDVAPPCDDCGLRPADTRVDGRLLCRDCVEDVDVEGGRSS
jgi:hypothetical protein